jgi:hypothetical protein
MRLLQILLMGLLFTVGEAMLPLVPVAEAAAEEIAEETSHPSSRRRARRAPTAADLRLPRVETIDAAARSVVRATPAQAQPNRRATTHRKLPPPARSSSATPEDH